MVKGGRPKKYDLDYILEDYERGLTSDELIAKYKISSGTLKSRLCDFRKGRLKINMRTITIRVTDEIYKKLTKSKQ